MDYYRLADGTLVGTQADARASKQKWEAHAVPTDKQGLMNYVNGLNSCRNRAATLDSDVSAPRGPDAAGDAPSASQGARDTLRNTLARIDSPAGVDVDQIGEVILKSSGYVLASFAEAVAMRYGMLAESRRQA